MRSLPAAERGGNPEVVRESQRRRYADVSLVDKVLEKDLKWREGAAPQAAAGALAGMNAGASAVHVALRCAGAMCLRPLTLCAVLFPTSLQPAASWTP